MPVNNISSSNRNRAAVAAAAVFAIASGWTAFTSTRLTLAQPKMTPAIVHEAVNAGLTPPAVRLAVDFIKDWEGLVLPPTGILSPTSTTSATASRGSTGSPSQPA